jgi:ketosteroid isomerase-like protein
MPRIAAAALALAALSGIPPALAGGPAHVVHDWAAAHEEGRADRAIGLYTSNARVWSVGAPREWVGHDDIGHYLAVFALGAAPPAFRIETYGLTPLGEGVVVASGHCSVVREQWDGGLAEEACRFSLMLVQDGTGGWRIAAQHSSAVPR